MGAVDTAPAESSRVTILQAPGKRLTKTYARIEQGEDHQARLRQGISSSTAESASSTHRGLVDLLRELQGDPTAA